MTRQVGFAGILARLADVVAALIVRGWVEAGCGKRRAGCRSYAIRV